MVRRSQPRLQLLLKDNIPKHQTVPKEYNLDITDPQVHNTYVFSEQDLPGYAAKNKAKADAIKAGIPAYLMKSKNEKDTPVTSWERRKKGGVPPRKSIPKKTAIAGRIRHELAGVALKNIETETIVRREREEAMKPKAETDIVGPRAIDPSRILQAGTQSAHDAFNNFIVRTELRPLLILVWTYADMLPTENGAEGGEDQEDGQQDDAYGRERAVRPDQPLLQRVQLLADEGAPQPPAPARGVPARDARQSGRADPHRRFR